jgi:hypothetical protein
MAFLVTPEEIAAARKMNALEYLERCEPQELVRVSGGLYRTRAHDSLKIREDGRWFWWSRGVGGYSALDYIVAVKGYSLPEAVHYLTGKGEYTPPRDVLLRSGATFEEALAAQQARPPPRASSAPFVLPPRNADNKRVFAYLTRRGIDPEIINHCIKHGLLYEEAGRHNAVFVGYDGDIARYAAMRGTFTDSKFKRDVDGSDKRFCFSMQAGEAAGVLYCFESAIDALSFATLLKMKGRAWRDYPLLSMGGVYKAGERKEKVLPVALERYLRREPATGKILLCFDSDDVGRGAAELVKAALPDRTVEYRPPLRGKDYNDYLRLEKGMDAKVTARRRKEKSAPERAR